MSYVFWFEKNTEEIPFYEVEFELELPKYKDIEIQNLANNENGIHNSNHYTTAYDMYLIAKYAMKNEKFVANAPKELVEQTNARIEEITAQEGVIKDLIESLK